MISEWGGYLPLELIKKNEYFIDDPNLSILRLNSGRAAIVAALKNEIVENVYLPYFDCQVVETMLRKHGYNVLKYRLNADMQPDGVQLGSNDWLIYIDYFGLDNYIQKNSIVNQYRKVIFDNTQAFYANPIIGKYVYNVYSCRKFFGVSDGSYLVSSREKSFLDCYEQDYSSERCKFLFKSIEYGTNGAYEDSLESEDNIGYQIKKMSKLTQRIMQSIDYDEIAEVRRKNFDVLKKRFEGINEMNVTINKENVPLTYPLLITKDEVRKKLIEKRVYVPQWWKYLIDMLESDCIEVVLSKYLLPLPIDQRYNIKDMERLADIVEENIHG